MNFPCYIYLICERHRKRLAKTAQWDHFATVTSTSVRKTPSAPPASRITGTLKVMRRRGGL
ncbi:MAG: hypothetical protein NTW21_11250 [Verrucomicrobia bacterium]|nr:hypothetical protein [Verrucomicrobiota bacterium]